MNENGSDFWRDRPVLVTGATGLVGGWLVERLLQAAQVTLPRVLPCKGVRVYTKKKLPEERKSR